MLSLICLLLFRRPGILFMDYRQRCRFWKHCNIPSIGCFRLHSCIPCSFRCARRIFLIKHDIHWRVLFSGSNNGKQSRKGKPYQQQYMKQA